MLSKRNCAADSRPQYEKIRRVVSKNLTELYHIQGTFGFEPLRAEIAKRGVRLAGVEDLIDDAWKIEIDVLGTLVGHWIGGLDLEHCHEPLGLALS
jgi:hypothetical protein